MKQKTKLITNRWRITDDNRAINALQAHIEQYGDFDSNGDGPGGNIASVVYRGYRPYACPQFKRVWPADGDKLNLTDFNLVSDADEISFDDANIVPITTQRRIWHDKRRIFVKLWRRNEVFFTEYDEKLFKILSNRKVLSGWYIQKQLRTSKVVHRLYCRVNGEKIVSFAELVMFFDKGIIDTEDISKSILAGKEWLRKNKLQIDHLKDNPGNNCPHNIVIMSDKMNGGKSDVVTEIMLPYVFIPVRVGETFRVLCGKARYDTDTDDFDITTLKMITCNGVDEFCNFLADFKKAANQNGCMLSRPDDCTITNCVAQMFVDDGQEFHGTCYNPIERLLRASDNDLIPCSGDIAAILR